MIYQPVAGVVEAGGSPPPESFTAVGGREEGRRVQAGLCVRVDDSAWSRPLNIAVQGAGGPFQVLVQGSGVYGSRVSSAYSST